MDGGANSSSVDCSLTQTCGKDGQGKRRAMVGAPREHAAKERCRSICKSCVRERQYDGSGLYQDLGRVWSS